MKNTKPVIVNRLKWVPLSDHGWEIGCEIAFRTVLVFRFSEVQPPQYKRCELLLIWVGRIERNVESKRPSRINFVSTVYQMVNSRTFNFSNLSFGQLSWIVFVYTFLVVRLKPPTANEQSNLHIYILIWLKLTEQCQFIWLVSIEYLLS